MDTTNRLVQIRSSKEQIEAMKAYFNHYDWEWNPEMVSENRSDNVENVDTSADDDLQPVIAPRADANVCDQCLCAPCVTDETNHQSWWPSLNSSVRKTNNIKRKILYKKFWTMLCHRVVFQTQTYMDRKSEAISRDRQRNYFMWHKRGTQRDILPNCVIHEVREWFPNPPSVSYVGISGFRMTLHMVTL